MDLILFFVLAAVIERAARPFVRDSRPTDRLTIAVAVLGLVTTLAHPSEWAAAIARSVAPEFNLPNTPFPIDPGFVGLISLGLSAALAWRVRQRLRLLLPTRLAEFLVLGGIVALSAPAVARTIWSLAAVIITPTLPWDRLAGLPVTVMAATAVVMLAASVGLLGDGPERRGDFVFDAIGIWLSRVGIRVAPSTHTNRISTAAASLVDNVPDWARADEQAPTDARVARPT